jgi:pimeloyl-ACP methyl ester carboxylesterase
MPAPPSPDDLHDDQLVALLRSGAHAALLSAYFGEVEYRELCQLAKLATTRRNPRGRVVFVLPGIMGSRLGNSSLLWLHPATLAAGALLQLAMPNGRPPNSIRALGVMLPGYLKLRLTLEIAGFRPLFHPFDWRLDLEQLARALTRRIEQACEAPGARKVFVVGHSMGGVIARIALRYDKQQRIEKLLQLGAPNGGSYAPVQALRAVYPTVRKIAALDHNHSAERLAATVFRTLPGLYQMLPPVQRPVRQPGELDLFDPKSWPADDGLAPDPQLLARAKTVLARLPEADSRCALVAGIGQETITAVFRRGDIFEYELRLDGDGTVPLSRALWHGARAWYTAENHGALTNNNVVLAALVDILKTGETQRLSNAAPALAQAVRRVTDDELRRAAARKVHWEALSLDSRRRILEPVISPEFALA